MNMNTINISVNESKVRKICILKLIADDDVMHGKLRAHAYTISESLVGDG
jgi:hypothetical protein